MKYFSYFFLPFHVNNLDQSIQDCIHKWDVQDFLHIVHALHILNLEIEIYYCINIAPFYCNNFIKLSNIFTYLEMMFCIHHLVVDIQVWKLIEVLVQPNHKVLNCE